MQLSCICQQSGLGGTQELFYTEVVIFPMKLISLRVGALIAIAVISAALIFRGIDIAPIEQESKILGKIYEAEVIQILSQEDTAKGVAQRPVIEQTLLIELLEDKRRVSVVNDLTPLEAGDRVYVQSSLFGEMVPQGQEESFDIINIKRTDGIILLGVLFVLAVLAVSGKQGVKALIGLLFSIGVVVAFLIPQIIAGSNAIIIGVAASIIILLGTLWISHGMNAKSLSALIGISLSLLLVGVLATVTIDALHFTGYTGEESVYLNFQAETPVNLIALLIAGIIIAAIGVLDDIAITQASTVFALASSNRELKGFALFKKAMEVGHDHLSAVVNTLFLAYTGASLPLILVLTLGQYPLGFSMSSEVIAQEIVRTILASFGLILAIPFTTAVAVLFANKKGQT